MKKALLLSLTFVAMLLSGCGSFDKAKAAADAGIARFHQLYNAGDLKTIWNEANTKLKDTGKNAEFTKLLTAVSRKLGKVASTTNSGWNIQMITSGTYIQLSQLTTFEKGSATETFEYRVNDDVASLTGYYVNSNDLITN